MDRKETTANSKVDVAMLRDSHIRNQFNKKLDYIVQTKSLTKNTTEETSNAMIRTLKEVAESGLPKVQKRHTAQTWKQDGEFNELLNERMNCQTGTVHYKELTKRIKKPVKHLRNQRLQKEADEINEYLKA